MTDHVSGANPLRRNQSAPKTGHPVSGVWTYPGAKSLAAIAAGSICGLILYAACIRFLIREFGILPSSHSVAPTVITTTAECDILRGVDQGQRYYVADCRPDRLSRRGVME